MIDDERIASFSPDLKTMISVGDSTEVQIFEVNDGGRDFRPITSYTGNLACDLARSEADHQAATDSGFSSAWSKDGRKFAVASQGEYSETRQQLSRS